MFDIRFIRDDPDGFDMRRAKRGLPPVAARILEMDGALRRRQNELQQLQAQRNDASREIGAAKAKGEDASAVIARVGELKTRAKSLEEQTRNEQAALQDYLAALDNLPASDVPAGGEADNVEVRTVGTPPRFDFAPRQHFELGEALGLMDFEIAARMSGARFVALRGALARLERALGDFMLDLHTNEFGYTEVSPPYLVRSEALFGTGQLPKFADDLFATTEDRWLIPTAEVPLTNLVREEIMTADSLPRRYVARTPCFRAEAGAAGKDTRGMIRQHQFAKVELVSVVAPEHSESELERMLGCAEEVLKRLGLAYRVVLLAAGDMGFAAQKTYDLEVWLPGQDCYREISSCSLCGDFQARRMMARFRPEEGAKPHFVHTLNGSGVAVGRALVAIMENYQRADGGIAVPDALQPYMGGLTVIEPST